ncbi:rust resistance kinase Lr10-like [Cocos nucifera]|nr:rust resistance kinase Lr10-like [Cocos nucifera]
MSRFLGILFLLVLQAGNVMITGGNEEEDFCKACPPSYCGGDGGLMEIRFPFRLETSPPSCGAPGLVLMCSGNETLLSLPESGKHRVIAIDYVSSELTIKLGEQWAPCPLQNLSFAKFETPIYSLTGYYESRLVGCSTKFMPNKEYEEIAGPISCLSSKGYFVYAVDDYETMSILPSDCMVVATGGFIPYSTAYNRTFTDVMEGFIRKQELILKWSVPGIRDECMQCELAGNRCGFSSARNQVFCISNNHHGQLPIPCLL